MSLAGPVISKRSLSRASLPAKPGSPSWLILFMLGVLSWIALAAPARANDGVYGRFHGDTDLSLKLGGLISDAQLAGSIGASAHYYSIIGVTGDYSESLVADALHTRSFSVGVELRPLFLPRWALGQERGPAWLDLTLDSASLGFGAYFTDAGRALDDTRGVWLSLGFGVPILARAQGPWVELRQLVRFPDQDVLGAEPRSALFVYLSWHHVLLLRPAH
jgi:hypothetical protein